MCKETAFVKLIWLICPYSQRSCLLIAGNEDETANKNAQVELVLMKTLGADIVYMNIIYGHCIKDPRSWVHQIFRNSVSTPT